MKNHVGRGVARHEAEEVIRVNVARFNQAGMQKVIDCMVVEIGKP